MSTQRLGDDAPGPDISRRLVPFETGSRTPVGGDRGGSARQYRRCLGPGGGGTQRDGLGVGPVYVLFWFDDGDGADGYSGIKQLSSLQGGRDLLRSCPGGVCELPVSR